MISLIFLISSPVHWYDEDITDKCEDITGMMYDQYHYCMSRLSPLRAAGWQSLLYRQAWQAPNDALPTRTQKAIHKLVDWRGAAKWINVPLPNQPPMAHTVEDSPICRWSSAPCFLYVFTSPPNADSLAQPGVVFPSSAQPGVPLLFRCPPLRSLSPRPPSPGTETMDIKTDDHCCKFPRH